MKTDAELLREFVETRAENAVAELVNRHINVVYSAACRETGGDYSAAEDVTQLVFIELVRKAAALQKHPTLVGWLYTTVRFISANIRRSDHRRNIREEKACAMNELLNPVPNDSTWQEIRPVLDDAMHELDARDRDAVLLRFFEGKQLREVGEALRLSENAARMRVDRALEKLRNLLAKRGVHSTSSALASALVVGVIAAPSTLSAAVTGAALATTAVSAGAASTLLGAITASKANMIGLSAAVVAAVSIPVWQQQRYEHLAQENANLRSQLEQLAQSRAAESARSQNVQPLPAQPVVAAATKPISRAQNDIPQEKPKETWRMRFAEYYRLRGGEVLRRITEPYIQERAEFLRREFRNPRGRPDYLVLANKNKDDFQTRGTGLYKGQANLDGVLRHVVGLKRYEFMGNGELLAMSMPGDWVVRVQADIPSLLAGLEPIVREATGHSIRFVKSPINDNVFVVRGTFAPAKKNQNVDVFAENRDRVWAKRSEGSFQMFLEALGDWLNVPFVNEVQLQNQLPISWYCHSDADYSRAGDRRVEIIKAVLRNLNQQTSLSFHQEPRLGEVWLIKEQ